MSVTGAGALAVRCGGRCGMPHWGYVIRGEVRVEYPDHEEVISAGDAYYVAPGHLDIRLGDSELVDFGPRRPTARPRATRDQANQTKEHHMSRSRRSAVYLLVPLIALAGLTSACGDDDDDDDEALTSETSAAGAADTDEPAADAAGDEAIEVVTVDYSFEGLPDHIDAGTTLTMHNDSEQEAHELVAFTIPPEETRTVEQLVALPQAELQAALPGEPALVMAALPGDDATPFVGDGTLPPGRYLVACAIPTGADPEAFMQAAQEAQDGPPQVTGGPPHFTAGMYTELVVDA